MARQPRKPATTTYARRVLPPVTALDATLKAMGARAPSVDEVTAIRALTRGNADPGQQRRAVTYIMSQLCGVGRVSFAGEGTNTTAFKLGAQAVAVAIAQIGDATLLRFEEMTDELETTPAVDQQL